MAALLISVAVNDFNGDSMSKTIMFKAKLQKSRDHFYIYVPKAWNEDLEEFYQKRKKIRVTIEVEEKE